MRLDAPGAALLLTLATAAQAEAPLSAIDWLSDSITEPVVLGPVGPPAEPPVADTAATEAVTTLPLDGPRPDAAGLLAPEVTGLPRRLWGPGDPAEIARLVRAEPIETLPSAQALLTTVLLAEAEPPAGTPPASEALLLARIDKLLELGLVEEAGALIGAAGPTTPEIFRRAFDVALLTGDEDAACESMRARPDVAPTFPARIFCLARGGDWNAAALTLGTTRALGQIDAGEEALLAKFLDPDLYEGEEELPPPERPTPLVYRMREAVGEPLPSSALPRAFAHGDLRGTVGWKAQIEAAERLVRTGAIDPNRLLGLYTERRPAASGGVWERVAAVQALDRALGEGEAGAIAAALPTAWDAMREAGLGHVLGALFGRALGETDLGGAAGALAFRIALLSPDYERAALAHDARDTEETLLSAVARGQPLPRAEGPAALALAGLAPGASPPAELAAYLSEGRLGEALLTALAEVEAGRSGDPRRLAGALATLRAAGLESAARRVALEYLILSDSA